VKPSIGRKVHYHFTNHRGEVATAPADVVAVFGDHLVNLQVQYDGANHLGAGYKDPAAVLVASWQTSVPKLEDGAAPAPHTWSWPPRVG
jgi:hypothetical protein